MNINAFSKTYTVRKLKESDIKDIYLLCKGNPQYYVHYPMELSVSSIQEDLKALPPGIKPDRKHYIGYYDAHEVLIAVMDLIDGYPIPDTVFIGFFMCDNSVQGHGIGSKIITELIQNLQNKGYRTVQLAWITTDTHAEHFWKKNGFIPIQETKSTDGYSVLLAERSLHETSVQELNEL